MKQETIVKGHICSQCQKDLEYVGTQEKDYYKEDIYRCPQCGELVYSESLVTIEFDDEDDDEELEEE
jgi:predicted  nucleic acid-binding Zn-ribbon protein